ncbi:MAG: D-alanyl-D-alanine carboxypeptidase/D-alanyl-D-alanine-endopeptidase [Ignavibacteriota bacterium]|nr:D-alanyl-D-alanine carboxypeptidase/D-alanyl-D-alanine-endopeptidase [Ignavibacteriota bacterium]MBW7843290.1 D-alanyl-D-alanine carboxypeptidase/D-alanyl-D-alanine-endopeptidase [Ignavibacterium sp.]MCO6447850.1 D-alanyl-D-alanine carboxypeptidase/D-alanyl-D-alanine-endopeptidase [Ignavibacterium album]MCZ2269218.1 D-alanyl-D-alanine carboxypeptidase/D-alanyl-D-alanine-endopeptidase [Ignavibacteriales bacterium]HOJ06554.1 D-alanyl-D-alanine carboxypeptidase/D-alanyl-D-alanine-endopeptidase 
MKIKILFFLLLTNLIYCISKEEAVTKINKILASLPANTISGIIVYNPLTQDTIFSVNEKRQMTPASLTKLFTTAVALNIMGEEHQLSTKLLTDDINLSDKVVNGNLYIKGYGNPTFSDFDLQGMINELISKGIEKITGNIIGDDTYLDNIYTREDWIEGEGSNIKLPPISALVLDRNKTVTRKKMRKRFRYVTEMAKDPAIFAANRLFTKLKENNIEVGGNSQKGKTPDKSILISQKSIFLNELIALINKHSDNFLAECLFKTLGAEATGEQGNSFYSQQAIQKFVKDNNIYFYGTEIVDGSGISRSDKVTPLSINGVLEKMYFDLNHFDAFYNSLSIAGVDGTLRGRMSGTFAENNFRGKTGTLNGVSGLAGYFTTPDGEDYIVTIMFEFTKGGWGYYRDIQDQIVEVLSELSIYSSDQ